MTDRIEQIIQEYADCPDDFDIKKVVAEIREIAVYEYGFGGAGWKLPIAQENLFYQVVQISPATMAVQSMHKCSYCGHVGQDVLRYEAKIGGSDELRTITACSDIDACLVRDQKCK